jgi:hypothetical protein
MLIKGISPFHRMPLFSSTISRIGRIIPGPFRRLIKTLRSSAFLLGGACNAANVMRNALFHWHPEANFDAIREERAENV